MTILISYIITHTFAYNAPNTTVEFNFEEQIKIDNGLKYFKQRIGYILHNGVFNSLHIYDLSTHLRKVKAELQDLFEISKDVLSQSPNINQTSTLNDAIIELKISTLNYVVSNRTNEAFFVFKRHLFPFGNSYLSQLNLPSSVQSNQTVDQLIANYIDQLDKMIQKVEELNYTFNDQMEYVVEDNGTVFYTKGYHHFTGRWEYQTHGRHNEGN